MNRQPTLNIIVKCLQRQAPSPYTKESGKIANVAVQLRCSCARKGDEANALVEAAARGGDWRELKTNDRHNPGRPTCAFL